jgi:hypothetical protein
MDMTSGEAFSQPTLAQSRPRWRRIARLVVPAMIIALTVVGLQLLAIGFPMLPRSNRRWVVEWLLRFMLAGYATILAGAILGIFFLGTAVYLTRRRGQGRALPARLLLLCVSILLSLAASEATAAVWLAWVHRMPVLPTHFDPDDGRAHIVVLGGSTALGHPYSPTLSVGQVVAWQLERVLPGRRFQADVSAFLGASLEDMHRKLSDLKQRPAAIVIFAGHNEFPSHFEEERNVDLDEDPRNPALHKLYRASLSSPLCRLIYQTLSKNRLDGPPPMMNRHHLVDEPMYTPSEAADVLENFRRRMEAIVVYCERIGAIPILLIEPGNESDYEPNRSLLPPAASPAERLWVEQQYRAARAAAELDSPRAMELYCELIERQPAFAEAHFRLARLLEQTGKWDEARSHYVLARDYDGMTFRCTTTFQNVYREIAARHSQCILVDGPEALRAICPHGIISDDAMQDGVHPSLRGITALAQAVLGALRSRQAFGWREGDAPALDPAPVAEHFGMNAERWHSVCDWGRSFYRWVAGFRFDPADHLAKAKRFEECDRLIAGGQSPDATGFAPLSLRPLPRAGRPEGAERR